MKRRRKTMVDDFKPVLKNSKFIYLWSSQILSQLTINIMNFILLIRLFATTGSSVATSLLWLSYALPAIFIGPLAAASVDMVDRRKMLMMTNLLQAVVVFAYAFLHPLRPYLVYSVTFFYSLLNQFYVPAEAASVPYLVDKRELPLANSLFFLTQQGSLIIGFGIAGILNSILGFGNTLYLCSILLFLAFLSTAFLPDIKVKNEIPEGLEEGIRKFFQRVGEGYVFIKEHKIILAPVALFLGAQVSLAIITVNVPAIATQIFKIAPDSAGILIVVPAAIGALVGAVSLPKLLIIGWRKKKVIEMSLIVSSLAIFSMIFIIPFFGTTLAIILDILGIALVGMSFIGVLIPAQTFLQEATPGDLYGRVFGNMWFLVTIATVIPVIFSGAVTDILGIRSLLLIFMFIILVVLIISQKYGQKILEGTNG